MPVDPKLEEHRYRYLIETHLYRIRCEENDPNQYQLADGHVKRAREFGMTERAIYERLRADNWYEDQADGEDVFSEKAWSGERSA